MGLKDPKNTSSDDVDSDVEEGPVATFQSYLAEGDILSKQGELRKAIEAYSKVLITGSVF
jgi:hypothetical protein